jgi:hypothetical protein
MMVIAICIKAYDGGPVLFTQDRLTKDGKVFRVYKFRSMRVENEKKEYCLTRKDDDRVTPVGKIIRNIHFDELPQLFNILKGDMSLVGPRPETPQVAQQYTEILPEFAYRLKVKAGLTGFAQVYGKYKTDALVNTGSDIEAYKQYASATAATPATVKKIDRIDAPTVSVKGPSLYLGNNVELRYAYQTAEKLEDLSAVVVIGGETTINVPYTDFVVPDAETGIFYVIVNQLNPAMMRDTVKVTIMKGETAISHSVTYSIASYVYDQAAAGTTGALMDTIKAMLTYGDAVAAWQA